jgi:hypothetical protein
LGFVVTKSREKHGAEPVQFGREIALLKSFSQCFCLVDCLKCFGDTMCKIQGFRLQLQI